MVAATSEEETPDDARSVSRHHGRAPNPGGASKPTDESNDGPTHQFQNLIVTKTATATFDREYMWDIDKSFVGDEKLWIPETQTATVDYVVTVTPKGVHESNWRITGTITVQNPNERDVKADVTDRVSFDEGLSVLGGQGNGGPGNGGHGDDDGAPPECYVAGGEGVVIPAGESEVLQYTCTFESDPGDSGTNTATAKWRPWHSGDNDAVQVEQMSGSSEDGQHEYGKRSASGSVDFTFMAIPKNRTISVYDDKTDPENGCWA